MDFNLDDFYQLLIDLSYKGKFKRVIDEIGNSSIPDILRESAIEDLNMMKKIIDSMTLEEKRNPQSLTKKHREEIANRCNVETSKIDRIITQFNKIYQDFFKMYKNYDKLISLMDEIKSIDLILERKYLSEFIDDSLVSVQNTPDAFPVLKSHFQLFLKKKRGIIVEYKDFLIYFIKSFDLDNQGDSLEYNIENINISLSGELEKEIDLNQIAQKYMGAEYNPDRSPGLIYRIQKPKATFIIFPEGRMVITGLKNVQDINPVLKDILNIIKKMGIKISDVKIKSKNIIANGNLSVKIDLNIAAIKLNNTTYEPEIFPGLIYRIQDLNVIFLIFSTGKFICTGAEDNDVISKAILILKEKMINFRI